MVRRSARWKAPKPDFTLQGLFLETARAIALKSEVLHAYRKSSGVLMRMNRSAQAMASLQAAADECAATCPYEDRAYIAGASQHAGRRAMCAYLGQWWQTSLCSVRPNDLQEGDEYLSREDVARMVERGA